MSKKKVRNVALFSLVRKNSLTEREREDKARVLWRERNWEGIRNRSSRERNHKSPIEERERERESLFSLRERKRVELGFAGWVRARVSNSIDEKVKNFSYHACNYCVF